MSVTVELGAHQPERMAAEDIIVNTRQVMQGLEALRSENQSIRQRLQEALLRERQLLGEREEALAAVEAEAVAVQALELLEEKHDLVCRSLEGIELGMAEAQVGTCGWAVLARCCCWEKLWPCPVVSSVVIGWAAVTSWNIGRHLEGGGVAWLWGEN